MRPLLIALAAALLAAPAGAQSQVQTDAEARVIVRFKPKADSVRAKALALRATRFEAREIAQTRATALGMRTGHALRAGLSLDDRTHVVMASGLNGAQLMKRLAADPEVEFAVVDQRRKHLAVPNDPLFGGATVNAETVSGGLPSRVIDQWYLKAPSSTPGQVVSSVNAPAAWDLTTGVAAVVVAVLDTGVRTDHPDLVGQFVSGFDMVGYGSPGATSTAIANDGGGADADPSDPGDWVSQADIDGGKLGSGCDTSDIGSSSWHGTRVSGLIAAKSDNNIGMAGVGRGLLKVQPIRVLGKCGGYDSDIMAGMKWAAGLSVPGVPTNTNKAKVLNLSLGGSGTCGTTDTGGLYRETIAAVNATGATIVIAAGNSEGQAVGLPGNCPGVIAVAALRHVGTKVGFSSIGSEVTIAAPGGNCINILSSQPCLYPMISTTNAGATVPAAYSGDGVFTGSSASVGTSFSAPVVSGIVGLMASVRPALTSAEAAPLLKLTARAFPTSGGTAGIAACKAPSGTAQDECYCTSSTCGAGMVDAFAAVKAAQALNNATVTVMPSGAGLTVSQSGTLTAAITGLASGKTVTATKWTLLDKGGNVVGDFSSGANTATVSLTPTAVGSFVVQADVTDSDGYVHSQVTTVNVAASPLSTPPVTSGGGGAVSAAWLLALLLAAFSLTRPKPQVLRCRP
jgi:serine protease